MRTEQEWQDRFDKIEDELIEQVDMYIDLEAWARRAFSSIQELHLAQSAEGRCKSADWLDSVLILSEIVLSDAPDNIKRANDTRAHSELTF